MLYFMFGNVVAQENLLSNKEAVFCFEFAHGELSFVYDLSKSIAFLKNSLNDMEETLHSK